MRAFVFALACVPALAFAQTPGRPPVDVRFEFERLLSQIETLLDRPLEDDLRAALRARLNAVVSRLEEGTADDRATEAFRLERRLARLRENMRGTFDNIPPALYEAYRRVLEDEERRTLEALRALGRNVE
jgi:hypothetical protein